MSSEAPVRRSKTSKKVVVETETVPEVRDLVQEELQVKEEELQVKEEEQEEQVMKSTSEVMFDIIKELNAEIKQKKQQVRSLVKSRAEVLTLEKDRKKQLERRKPANPNAKPSGLQMKVNVSKEFGELIGLPEGEQISRIEAVSRLYKFIEDHNLKGGENKNKRFVNLEGPYGAKVAVLLNHEITKTFMDENGVEQTVNVLEHDGLTIFTAQKLIKHHFTTPV